MFTGSWVALVTPMSDSGDVDYCALEQLIEWHVVSGTDGLVILGTTGESSTLTQIERDELIRFVIDSVKARLPVVVGVGSNATARVMELAFQAAEQGADGVLVVTPYYNKPTQQGLYEHFSSIAKAVNIPQILYNVPARTGCDLLPETVKKLSQWPSIVALKEATGCMDRLKALKALDCDLDLLSGDDMTAKSFMMEGGKGVISVVANVLPESVSHLCSAIKDKNYEKAEQIDQQLKPSYELMFVESNPIPVKWALHKMGKIRSGIRLPLTPLSDKWHACVQQWLGDMNQ